MSASDPTPLELAQPDAPRGRLKVFLGYAPGVGKSFRMFDEARRRKERGQDVVVAALQPQNPPELESILSSLETVPDYRHRENPGYRRPGNSPAPTPGVRRRRLGLRQPVESKQTPLARRRGTVGKWHQCSWFSQPATHRRSTRSGRKANGDPVEETIPREFLNTADEIVVVDAPTQQAAPELSALREKALVLAADVIDAGLQRYLQSHDIEPGWKTHERFLVCLTPRANTDRMIETGSTKRREISLRRSLDLCEACRSCRQASGKTWRANSPRRAQQE